LVFCIRLLPIAETLRTGTRLADWSLPSFKNGSFFLLRFFVTEILGVNYRESQQFFKNMSPLFDGFHLHGNMPSFFGVIAALLVLWMLCSEKTARSGFWSAYTVVLLGLISL